MEAGSPVQGLTGAQGHLDALCALQAAIPPAEFWSPKILGQVPQEVVDAFLDAMVDRRPAQRERLARSRELRGLPAVERIVAMGEILKGLPQEGALRRGLAWAGGLPLEVVGKLSRECLVLGSGSTVTWLPEGLHLHLLNVQDTGLAALPAGLRVNFLHISGCQSLKSLPGDVVVQRLVAQESGLSFLPRGLKAEQLYLHGCSDLKSLPAGLDAEEVVATSSGLEALPVDLKVTWLHLRDCTALRALPAGLMVGCLDLGGCRRLEALPDDLVVTERLYIDGTVFAERDRRDLQARFPGVTVEIRQ